MSDNVERFETDIHTYIRTYKREVGLNETREVKEVALL